MRKIIIFSLTLLFACIVNAQTADSYTFRFNNEKIGLDTFQWQKEPANIEVFDGEEKLVLSVEIEVFLVDSIVVRIKEDGRYPEGIVGSLNETSLPNDTLKFANLKFKKYELRRSKDEDAEYLLELKLKFGKKPKSYDLLILPLVRHLFTSSQTVQFREK